ncbi:DUF1611 domain-containing protein [Natrononativus amylolyticus]|uniref:DUF1611 domain-containing protein n=1 Tax=Natrononativus amylolyticus TaxID=2963434 RepID=UPI0020CD8076|nr:DUF1611 domain-containing protein [Natrononativus amylolyticus]
MNLRDAFDTPVSAIVLAEGEFGTTGGKTANGVVMHSEIFETAAVVDSAQAGSTTDAVLARPDVPSVPIVDSTEAALSEAPEAEALVIGVAPAGGDLPESWIDDIRTAMRAGCDVVSGLHVFLSDREEWAELAEECGVRLFDVRKPPEEDALRVGDGRVDDVDADIVVTMGTDCAVGKRTTTFELYRAAREAGLDAGWVATGQTGIMVGAHRGVVIDRVPADFTAGVVEDLVVAVAEDHDIVFVEGQAALTHRAYSGVTLSVLHGAWPDAVVLVDDPDRDERTHFDGWPIAGVDSEIEAIEHLSEATVAALSTWGDADDVGADSDVPVANVYDADGPETLLEAVRTAI